MKRFAENVCRSVQRQQQDQRPPRSDRSTHNIRQDDKPWPVEQDQHDRNFDTVKIKYLNFDNVISIIFSKSELSTSQKRVCISYRIDSGSNGNLMPFKVS